MKSIHITVRKAAPGDEAEINRVIIRTWKSSYRGIIDGSYLDSLNENDASRLDRLRINIENGCIYTAQDNGTIVGIAVFGGAKDERYKGSGELNALYVLKEYQYLGVGRRLIGAVKGELRLRGYRTMIIGCLTDNSACTFYEKEGGVLAGHTEHPAGGKNYRVSIFRFEI